MKQYQESSADVTILEEDDMECSSTTRGSVLNNENHLKSVQNINNLIFVNPTTSNNIDKIRCNDNIKNNHSDRGVDIESTFLKKSVHTNSKFQNMITPTSFSLNNEKNTIVHDLKNENGSEKKIGRASCRERV